jgi:hypothetical protein
VYTWYCEYVFFTATVECIILAEENDRISYFKYDLSDEQEIAVVCKMIRPEVGHLKVLARSVKAKDAYNHLANGRSQQCSSVAWADYCHEM